MVEESNTRGLPPVREIGGISAVPTCRGILGWISHAADRRSGFIDSWRRLSVAAGSL